MVAYCKHLLSKPVATNTFSQWTCKTWKGWSGDTHTSTQQELHQLDMVWRSKVSMLKRGMHTALRSSLQISSCSRPAAEKHICFGELNVKSEENLQAICKRRRKPLVCDEPVVSNLGSAGFGKLKTNITSGTKKFRSPCARRTNSSP